MSKVSMCKTEKLHSTFLEHKNIHTCKCCLNESWSIYRFVPRVVHHTTKIVKCRLDFFNLLVLFKRYAPHIISLSGLIFVIFYEIQPIVKYKDSKVLIKKEGSWTCRIYSTITEHKQTFKYLYSYINNSLPKTNPYR